MNTSVSSGSLNSTRKFDLFNNKLADFLEDLKGVLGHLPEYRLLCSSSRLLTQMDVRRNCAMFVTYVGSPYGDQIMAKDEEFLLSHDFMDAPGAKECESAGGVVELIKGAWKTMSPQDKESVWGHLAILVVISRK
jgi:hypothetical protein